MFFTSLLIAHFIFASVITGHALLKKRDVRSAIGWIGLTWLSPVLGAFLYYLFGINRVARRAAKRGDQTHNISKIFDSQNERPHDDLDEHMAILSLVGAKMSEQPLLYGNRVDVLQNGDAAYPAMLADIRAAKRSICLATYIFRSDEVGEQFADALISAHKRGVKICVLVDAIGSGFLVSSTVRRLNAEGLKVARFMFDGRLWNMAFINLRNHKKLLLIDGERGYVGGLNLGSENTLRFVSSTRVTDIHFSLCGPIIAQLMHDFTRDWEFATGSWLHEEIWWPDIAPTGDAVCRAVTSGPDEDVGKIETLFATALMIARNQVRIVTPYFLPDEKLCEALRLAALRGVRIEVIIPEKSDHVIIDWATRGHLSFLENQGITYFLSTTSFDHAKLITVDGQWCAFGSPNWDVRSLQLNFELLVECYTHSVVSTIDDLIDKKLETSRRLSREELNELTMLAKLRNATARLFLPYL